MTHFQQLLYVLGFWRFKRYRRWVGGRWAERLGCAGMLTSPCHYIEPTPHSSEYLHWRWEPDPGARFNDHTHAIEQWPIELPEAHVRRRK